MTKIHVLMVEDSDDDYELLARELRKGPFETTCTRVKTMEDLKARLADTHIDIILCDYELGEFNAMDVLKTLKSNPFRPPCIIVSGTIGEETAVEAIQNGAKDYIIKDRPGRLVSAIEREVARRGIDLAQELLLKAAHDALWDWDLMTDLVHWNEGLYTIFGYDIKGRTTTAEWERERVHPDDRARVLAAAAKTFASTTDSWTSEYRLRRADGTYATVLDRAYISRSRDGRVIRCFGAMIDITAQKEAELRVLERENQLKQAQHVALMGSFELDVVTSEVTVSDELYRIYELPPGTLLNASNRRKIIHPEDLSRVTAMLKTALREPDKYQVDYRVSVPSGIKYIHSRMEPVFSEAGKLRKYRGISQDITERINAEKSLKTNEEQLRQLQKMDAIGRLAGGIAHDYNNMLAAIQMYCELAREEATPAIAENLEQINSIVTRGAALTRQLLLFSRKQPRFKKPLQLNQSILHIEKMLRRLIGEMIHLDTRCAQDVWPIDADPGQVDQVLLNLVVNARDAMVAGGKVQIRTSNVSLGFDVAQRLGIAPGRYVQLSIEDTGTGITPEVREKIFEPFFTTKAVGQGTGLGLSTVYGIMQEHDGAVDVESEIGKGSTFHVFFPASESKISPEVEFSSPPKMQVVPNSCVLLVEDEMDLRVSFEKILRQRGFRVVAASNGQEALALFEKHSTEIYLVITDMTMPEMGGLELTERIHRTHPHVPVIFMSGYTENHEESLVGRSRAPYRFVTKPFSSATLTQLIHELLPGKLLNPQ